MVRYWAMRTDRDEKKFIYKEIKAGRLRQGWGDEPYLDLNKIRELESKGLPFEDDYQEDVWKKQRRLHPEEEDGIRKGDYIILPHLPDEGDWSIVKVDSNKYSFEMDDKLGNYGHIRYVELLNKNFPINPYSEYVSGNLRKTMTCRLRLWNIDDYAEDVEKLLKNIKSEYISKPTTETEKILKIYSKLSDKLESELKNKYHGSEFEKPIERLLKNIYDIVECRAGSGEKGADFICTFSDGLGITYRVAIQVKMWEGTAESYRPLDQIKEAYHNYENIAAGAIITTTESVSEDFEEYKEKIEKELNIPIAIIDKKNLTNAFFRFIPELIIDSE